MTPSAKIYARVAVALGVSSAQLLIGQQNDSLLTNSQTIIKFDVPEAGTGLNQGTRPLSLNTNRFVVGQYVDSNNVTHGFLRSPNGNIVTFDAPGVGTNAYGTFPTAINDSGLVVGYFYDSNNVIHGFIRNLLGAFMVFDEPLAGTAPFQGTYAIGINASGELAGTYFDASFNPHGYVRRPHGVFQSFEFSPSETLYVNAINSTNTVTGDFFDLQSQTIQCFVRSGNGTIGSFHVGSGTTVGTAINDFGSVTGYYEDSAHALHGFLLRFNGAVWYINAQGAGIGPNQGTVPEGINLNGIIVGVYYDAASAPHGFIRAPTGSISTLDIPGASGGDVAAAINSANSIVGSYFTSDGVIHGYLLVP